MCRGQMIVLKMPSLAGARKLLTEQGAICEVTLIITGGLRVPMDFVKAMALGADGVAISNSAMQSIGCVAARIVILIIAPLALLLKKQIYGSD